MKTEEGEDEESDHWCECAGPRLEPARAGAGQLPATSFAEHLPGRPLPELPVGRGTPRGTCRPLASDAPGLPRSPAAGHCTRREIPAQDPRRGTL